MITLQKGVSLHKDTRLNIAKATIEQLKQNINFCINVLGQDKDRVYKSSIVLRDVYKQPVKLTVAQLFVL